MPYKESQKTQSILQLYNWLRHNALKKKEESEGKKNIYLIIVNIHIYMEFVSIYFPLMHFFFYTKLVC